MMEIGLFWFGFAIAVGVLASNRGRHGFGWFLLACIISPLLAIIFLLVTKNRAQTALSSHAPNEETHVRCKVCAEYILPQALKCKHCGAPASPDPLFEYKVAEKKSASKNEETKNLLIGIGFIVALIVLAKMFS
jgi:hypothetical protein